MDGSEGRDTMVGGHVSKTTSELGFHKRIGALKPIFRVDLTAVVQG